MNKKWLVTEDAPAAAGKTFFSDDDADTYAREMARNLPGTCYQVYELIAAYKAGLPPAEPVELEPIPPEELARWRKQYV